MIQSNNTSWFTSITVLLLFWWLAAFLAISYNLVETSFNKTNWYTDKTISLNFSQLGIEDAKSFFLSNRDLFYDIDNISPCDSIGSISSYANYNIDSFVIADTLKFQDDIIWSENLKDDQWFLNRHCSIYTKWIPHKNVADFSIKDDPIEFDSVYEGQVDENWYYNISKILDNQWMWIFFTSNQIWESNINIKLDYNFEEFEGIDSLNIYDEDLQDKILLLKKNDPDIDISKSNLRDILTDSLSLFSDANLEIWIVEFDGTFNADEGFRVDKNSGWIIESTHINWWNNQGTTRWRLLCDGVYKTCELRDISLSSNKIYFVYLKSFEKPTTFHIDITNQIGDSLFIPSNYLTVKNFWVSNWVLSESVDSIDISKRWWYFSDFSSDIYNYVYFSRN